MTFDGTETAAQFYARRDIEENEELFFDYDIKQDFEWLKKYQEKYMVEEVIFIE